MDTWWYLTTGYFYLDIMIGINVCEIGAYLYLSESTTYECELERYYLYDLIDYAIGGESYGNLGLNTCDKERPSWVKVDEPGGP